MTTNAIVEALASSSAHGISRAASTNNTVLRVAWLIVFLIFLSLFGHGAICFILKLVNVTIVTTSEIDKVPFQFPDMYFCPRHILSGSYPYSLNQAEADFVNAEIDKLERWFQEFMAQPAWKSHDRGVKEDKMATILNSLTQKSTYLLLKRPEQSINPLTSQSESSQYTLGTAAVLLTEGSRLCFKLVADHEGSWTFPPELFMHNSMAASLFTDAYTSHMNYSGCPVRPIRDPTNNSSSIPLPQWDFIHGIRRPVTSNAFDMLIVAPNAYPSILIEPLVTLAPGRSYDITVSMEEVAYSDDLQNVNCTKEAPSLSFLDLLTGKRLEYNYSFAGCFVSKLTRMTFNETGFVESPKYPVPWDLRHSPRWNNVTDMLRANAVPERGPYIAVDRLPTCQQACSRLRYKTSISFGNWPIFSENYSSIFPKWDMRMGPTPVLDKLKRMARQLDEGNHSPGLQAQFRSFLSDTMLHVTIRPEKAFATRLVISKSYSVTLFLADIGGLLGLYIGCSMLTVCELMELLYHLVMMVAGRRLRCCHKQPRQEEHEEELS